MMSIDNQSRYPSYSSQYSMNESVPGYNSPVSGLLGFTLQNYNLQNTTLETPLGYGPPAFQSDKRSLRSVDGSVRSTYSSGCASVFGGIRPEIIPGPRSRTPSVFSTHSLQQAARERDDLQDITESMICVDGEEEIADSHADRLNGSGNKHGAKAYSWLTSQRQDSENHLYETLDSYGKLIQNGYETITSQTGKNEGDTLGKGTLDGYESLNSHKSANPPHYNSLEVQKNKVLSIHEHCVQHKNFIGGTDQRKDETCALHEAVEKYKKPYPQDETDEELMESMPEKIVVDKYGSMNCLSNDVLGQFTLDKSLPPLAEETSEQSASYIGGSEPALHCLSPNGPIGQPQLHRIEEKSSSMDSCNSDGNINETSKHWECNAEDSQSPVSYSENEQLSVAYPMDNDSLNINKDHEEVIIKPKELLDATRNALIPISHNNNNNGMDTEFVSEETTNTRKPKPLLYPEVKRHTTASGKFNPSYVIIPRPQILGPIINKIPIRNTASKDGKTSAPTEPHKQPIQSLNLDLKSSQNTHLSNMNLTSNVKLSGTALFHGEGKSSTSTVASDLPGESESTGACPPSPNKTDATMEQLVSSTVKTGSNIGLPGKPSAFQPWVFNQGLQRFGSGSLRSLSESWLNVVQEEEEVCSSSTNSSSSLASTCSQVSAGGAAASKHSSKAKTNISASSSWESLVSAKSHLTEAESDTPLPIHEYLNENTQQHPTPGNLQGDGKSPKRNDLHGNIRILGENFSLTSSSMKSRTLNAKQKLSASDINTINGNVIGPQPTTKQKLLGQQLQLKCPDSRCHSIEPMKSALEYHKSKILSPKNPPVQNVKLKPGPYLDYEPALPSAVEDSDIGSSLSFLTSEQTAPPNPKSTSIKASRAATQKGVTNPAFEGSFIEDNANQNNNIFYKETAL